MSKCRGQWAEDQPFGTCIQCGGKLSDHETYAAWMRESTYDERRVLGFNPPLAIHQPPALLTDPHAMKPLSEDALQRAREAVRSMVPVWTHIPAPQPPKPPLTEREQRLQDMGNQIGRAVDRLSSDYDIRQSFVMGHR
jgi:hypothetical protein